jgi:hypothetical protein
MLSYVRYYTRPQEDKLLHKNRLNTMLYEMHISYIRGHCGSSQKNRNTRERNFRFESLKQSDKN